MSHKKGRPYVFNWAKRPKDECRVKDCHETKAERGFAFCPVHVKRLTLQKEK